MPLDPVGGSAPKQFAKVVARRRQGGFLQLPCSLGFRLASSATGGARLPQFPKVVVRRRQGGFLQLPCSLGFRLASSATGGARLPQFPKVVVRRRQGGFLQLPCSLGFRLASSATGGARLRPPAAFKKAGENRLENFSGFLADYASPPLMGSGGLVLFVGSRGRKGVADDSFGRQKTATARGAAAFGGPGAQGPPGLPNKKAGAGGKASPLLFRALRAPPPPPGRWVFHRRQKGNEKGAVKPPPPPPPPILCL